MIDLHTHSTASDGDFSPSKLVNFAKERGLKALALTDHDTTSGLEEALEAGLALDVRIIPGIEFDIDFAGGEFHLLGLGLKKWDGHLDNFIQSIQLNREHRNVKILRLLQEDQFDITWEDLVAQSGSRLIGRPHIAQVLVNKGYVKSTREAFDRYLGNGKRYHISKEGIPLTEALQWIKDAGGKAVIAHPLSLYLGWDRLIERLMEWRELGLWGLEAYHPGAPLRHCKRLDHIAHELGYHVTAGSDFHSTKRRDRHIGRTAGGKVIEDVYGEPFLS